jgi:arylsulfatase A-like enzyme
MVTCIRLEPRDWRLRSLKALAVLGIASILGGCAEPMPLVPAEKPNVVVLLIDCLRADHLGVNGYERDTTPSLDSLASEGINFTRAFSQALWTRPSVPSLLTGLYPSEHGLVSLGSGVAASSGPALAPEVETLAESLQIHGYATALLAYQAQLSSQFGLNQGFDRYRANLKKAARINQQFLAWAGDQGETPFFAYLHYLEVHMPYCPPRHTRGRFYDKGRDMSFCKGWRMLKKSVNRGEAELSEGQVKGMIARYDEEVLALDAELGRLFLRMKEQGIWDNTLLIVTADHGEQFYEHGTVSHQFGLWDEVIHVPLIVKTPSTWDSPTGASIESLVELRDIVPTILEALGQEVKEGRHSLLAEIVGRAEEAEPRRYVVAESAKDVIVRTTHLKLFAAREGGRMRLFDLIEDPSETVDIAESRPAEVARLRKYLVEWRSGLEPILPVGSELEEETLQDLKALGYLD